VLLNKQKAKVTVCKI